MTDSLRETGFHYFDPIMCQCGLPAKFVIHDKPSQQELYRIEFYHGTTYLEGWNYRAYDQASIESWISFIMGSVVGSLARVGQGDCAAAWHKAFGRVDL